MDEHNQPASEDTQASQTPEAETPQAKAAKPFPCHELEREVDLNTLFPDADKDLNALFPDEEMKRLLKGIHKNKNDLHKMRERFTVENDVEEVDVEEALEHLQGETGETSV